MPASHAPVFLKPHPRANASVVIASDIGHVQVVDTTDPLATQYLNVEVASHLTSMDVAPTGEGLAFGDADGLISLYASAAEPIYVRQPAEIELPDPVEPPKAVNWTPDTPLNVVGMPYYTTQLLSWIDYAHYATPYTPLLRPPVPIDPAVLANMRMVDYVAYAPNPKTALRNQATPARGGVDASGRTDKRRLDTPMFRSERERKALAAGEDVDASARPQLPESPTTEKTLDPSGALAPKYYRRVEIKYSKFGVDDFDFACVALAWPG